MTEEQTEFGRGYEAAMSDLYEWAYETTREWHSLNIVTDSQMLALTELVHEMDKKVNWR